MKTSTAALAVLFVAVLCYEVSSSPAAVKMYGPCCMQYSTQVLPSSRVVKYQHTGSHCARPAVIFTTVKDKMICVKPGDRWVQDIINQLENKKDSG
ncbi:CCL4 protein, partial [Baryphthengus martii]|nr:CCL4 protein [Baryphthengus martii]